MRKSRSKFDNVLDEIHKGIDSSSLKQIERINDNVIRDALNAMKAKKSDAMFDISSDCYIHGPPELVKHLTFLMRTFLTHGCVPKFVLLCTLLPLVKDKLGDATASDNYRAIASGCLLLKLVDLVVSQLE